MGETSLYNQLMAISHLFHYLRVRANGAIEQLMIFIPGRLIVRVLSLLGIVGIRSSSSSSPDEDSRIEVTNFTMVNFCLRIFGPKHEGSLTALLLAIQVGLQS